MAYHPFNDKTLDAPGTISTAVGIEAADRRTVLAGVLVARGRLHIGIETFWGSRI